ncbi:ABC transporter ATP-binding protein/permease [Massilia solisilvae]|uniref:ABC transporter ATP-binding protein/permease n=1 Tax=Massilia solisilvae TaxID=1811225 RepID=A0ABT2BE58_9BURK|nr:ABC transporter ATP-binding protein [Massilia solisilvae]MCS0606793.1 ABC transporter ATP-binding protein/permease [Massilia solisilvae]
MNPVRAASRVLGRAPASRVGTLLALMILGALTEGAGFMLLVPLLNLLGGGAARSNGIERKLTSVLDLLHLPLTAGVLLAGFVALVSLRAALQYGRERLATSLQHGLVDQLRQQCFHALLNSEWRWLSSTRQADQANLLLTDASRVGTGLHFGLALLANTVAMAAHLAVALALSWSLTVAALAGGLAVFALLAGQRGKALQLGRELGKANRAMQRTVQESLGGIKLAKILRAEGQHEAAFARHMATLRIQQHRFSASSALGQALFQAAGAALLAAYLYFGLGFWHTPVPVLVTLVFIFSRLIPLLMAAHQQLHQVLHALPALEESERLLAECTRHAEPTAAARPNWPVSSDIELDAVTVSYDGRERPALASVSAAFRARTTTAIVGASGAGKSTLADILMGLLAPDSGKLRVGGEEIRGSLRQAWRAQVAYVPQETYLFHATIRENLLWARPDATDAELAIALEHAAAGFVLDLPQGLDTLVGDGGVLLSGGERQRLGLARALLCKPSLLILDEATSALDIDNEMRVRKAIENLHGELTVVLIGHRLATLEHADQVIVLGQGCVLASGTWTEVRPLQPNLS